jgi:hypothetical protein
MPIGTLKGAAGGAATGATIGTAFGPAGTVAGAAIGGVVGGIGGLLGDITGGTAAGQEYDYLTTELDTLNQSLADLTGLGTMKRGIELEKFDEQRERLAFGGQTSMKDILESYNRARGQTGLRSGAVEQQREEGISQVRAEHAFGMQNLQTALGDTLLAADEWQGGREAAIKETIADVERRRTKAKSESTWLDPFD